MKHFRSLPLFVWASIILFNACNDATVIGSDLVSDEELNISSTDTVTFTVYSEVVDSISLYNLEEDIFFEQFPFGDFVDPIFGRSTSALYAQVTTSSSAPDFDVMTQTLDSVVLILPFNTGGFYGDTSQTFSLEVWEITEELPDNETSNFHSNQTFALGDMMGQADFIPSYDSVLVGVPRLDTSIKVGPQLRIVLNETFANKLFEADAANFEDVDAFAEFFKGFHLKPNSTNNGMVNFDMRAFDKDAGIKVYFREDTTSYFDYSFPIFSSQVVTANYEHDYTGSIAEPYLGENSLGRDSLLFVQAMEGINLVVEFPYIESLENILLNEAVIEFPILTLEGDNEELFYSPNQILISELMDDGSSRFISDVEFAIGGSFSTLFGGVPNDDSYKMNITSYLQDAMRGLVGNRIEVFISLKPEKAQRLVLAGPKHATNPAKMNITFTDF